MMISLIFYVWVAMSLLWTVTMGWYRLRPHHSNWLCIALQDVSRMPQAQHLSTLVVISVYHWLRNVMSMTDCVQIWWSFQVGSKTVIWRKKQSSWPLASIWAHPLCPFDVVWWWVAPGHHHKARLSQAMMDHGLTIHGLRVSFMGIYLEYIHRWIGIQLEYIYIYI